MKYRNLVILIITLVVFAFLAWRFSNILLYFIISAIIATLLRPLTKYLSGTRIFRIRIPKVLAILISYLTLILVIGAFVTLFIPLISAQIEVLNNLSYDSVSEKISAPIDNFESFLRDNQLTQREEGFLINDIKNDTLSFIQKLDISELVNNILSLTGGLFIGFLAVTFISFFMLYDSGIIKRQIISLVPNAYFEITIGTISKIEKLLSNYLVGLLIQMLFIFTLASIGLSILGIKFALTIALFAAIANLIPYLGPIIGASFGIIVGISTSVNVLSSPREYFIMIISIIAVFAIVQIVDNLLLQPLIFSRSVKAHPLEIFVVIFAGASLAGIPGMIAAIPAYTVLRVSFKEFYTGYKGYRIFKTA